MKEDLKEKKSGPVVLERVYNAPIEKVWKALTVNEEMKEWYFNLAEFRPEVGFEFRFDVTHEGNEYIHLCKVTEVVPGRKIAYSWRYKDQPGDSVVSFELFKEGDKTKLRLVHEGLDSFPKTPAYAKENFVAGWTDIIGNSLKQYVEK